MSTAPRAAPTAGWPRETLELVFAAADVEEQHVEVPEPPGGQHEAKSAQNELLSRADFERAAKAGPSSKVGPSLSPWVTAKICTFNGGNSCASFGFSSLISRLAGTLPRLALEVLEVAVAIDSRSETVNAR